MILLPRSWRTGSVRAAVNGVAWVLVLLGLYGSYREACGAEGWGSFILTLMGLLLIVLLEASAEGLAPRQRARRLVLGVAVLVLALLFVPIFQETIRFACPA